MCPARQPFSVRPARMRDISGLSALLQVCWHTTNDALLGLSLANSIGQRVYSRVNLAIWIARSHLSAYRLLIASAADGSPVGCAMAERDGAEIVLYMLYVHPDWHGQGVGSALLGAICARYPDAKAIRLEVLKGNAAAIAWYKAKGFESYGETQAATGTADVTALYMDKQLTRPA